MKRALLLLVAILCGATLTACSSGGETAATQSNSSTSSSSQSSGVDIDLTTLSSTVVYTEVYNMTNTPSKYIGKKIKMKGRFSYLQDDSTKNEYFSCIIADAAACCSQGIEFVLDGEHIYPNDYPEKGSEITVTGTFETYDENGTKYCRLGGATLV